MARRRFYSNPDNIRDSAVTLSPEETHHLIHVLRMTPGNEAFVFDGFGREYRCVFRKVTDSCADLEIQEELTDAVESAVEVTLAQSLAKGDKFDFIVQKATELGVARIAPLASRYADLKLLDDQVPRKLDRWRRISLEALKQCGRRRLVEILSPQTPAEYLVANESADSSSQTSMLLFSERGGMSIVDALGDSAKHRSVVAFVGPEGGWSDDEIAVIEKQGAKPVSLGPRVLRTETAAIVALTLILNSTGEI